MKTDVNVSMPDEAGMLRVRMLLADATPTEVVQAFTDPDLLRRWWGNAELTIEPRAGGDYVVYFKQLEQTMRGSVIELEPTRGVAFTWAWDHETGLPPRRVLVSAEQTPHGSQLRLEHGPYNNTDADRADAESHRQGWEFFLPRLADALAQVRGGG